MTYWRLYYHVVWGTKDRLPMLDAERAVLAEQAIVGVAMEHDALIHAIGFMPDHVHLAISIPPDAPISTVIGKMKGLSSFRINREHSIELASFKWQPEFGVISISERALDDVMQYVRSQPERHRDRKLYRQMETFGPPKSWSETNSAS